MTKETRKHIRLVSLVMAVAVVGVLAGFLVLGGNPGATQAHGGPSDATHCDGMSSRIRSSTTCKRTTTQPPPTRAMTQPTRRLLTTAV